MNYIGTESINKWFSKKVLDKNSFMQVADGGHRCLIQLGRHEIMVLNIMELKLSR